ncbi:MAG: M14 family zinc carboxypeptidase [Dokdonella sp.]
MFERLLLLTLGFAIVAPAGAVEWFVEARFRDAAMLSRTAGMFQHAIIDSERHTLRVDTDDEGIRRLQEAGLNVLIDMPATAALRGFYAPADGISSIPGYACYRTVEETYQSIDDIVLTYPTLASVEEIGPSWERTQEIAQGYSMRALRVTNRDTLGSQRGRPRMVLFGSIHAREYTPAELLTRMAEWLVTGYGIDAQATWLVDHVDFRFILQANPDGRKKAESGILWRKNTNVVDAFCPGTPTSSRQPGVDLNRNFPFHWNFTNGSGSSGSMCSEIYRGPQAASEPETENLVRYVAGTPDVDGVYRGGALPDSKPAAAASSAPAAYAGLFFDVHSYSRLVVWPWGDTAAPAPNSVALQTLGRRIAWFNNYTPAQSSDPEFLYTTDGTTVDTVYGLLGAPSFTIELGTSFFESCANFANTTLPLNLAALRYAARTAHAPYQLSAGPDIRSISLSAVRVIAGQAVILRATVDDNGLSTANGTQPSRPIDAAISSIGVPPWHGDAMPLTLDAEDGAFDSAVENVSGTLQTGTLAAGRHLIYVQGITRDGAAPLPGAPDAVFLDIIDANDVIFMEGFDASVR